MLGLKLGSFDGPNDGLVVRSVDGYDEGGSVGLTVGSTFGFIVGISDDGLKLGLLD